MLFGSFKKSPPLKSLRDIDFEEDERREALEYFPNPMDGIAPITSRPKKEKPKKVHNSLYIDLGYTTVSWVSKPFDISKGKVYPWKDFYKWYFSTTKPEYVMTYKEGERMFLRKDIRTFHIEITENET